MAAKPTTFQDLPDLRKLTRVLVSEVVALDKSWTLFTSLYFDKDRAASLGNSCPLTYQVVALALQRDMGVLIDRLFDPPQSRVGKTYRWNASIPALVDVAKNENYLSTTDLDALCALQQKCESTCNKFSPGRNRLLAHLDYLTVIGDEQVALPLLEDTPLAIESIREFVDGARTLLGFSAIDWHEYLEQSNTEADVLTHKLSDYRPTPFAS